VTATRTRFAALLLTVPACLSLDDPTSTSTSSLVEPNVPPFPADLAARLDELTLDCRNGGCRADATLVHGVTAAVLLPDGSSWSRGIGYYSLGGAPELDASSPMDWGSATKTVTAIVILRLVELGFFDGYGQRDPLDTRLADLGCSNPMGLGCGWGFPSGPPNNPVTIRSMLNMTSGLPGSNTGPVWSLPFLDWNLFGLPGCRAPGGSVATIQKWSQRYYFTQFNRLPLNFEPDRYYSYENTNYMLLARIAEDVVGHGWSFAALADALVFRPAGLSEHTYIRPSHLVEPPDASYAVGAQRDGHGNWDDVRGCIPWGEGASNMISTAVDQLRLHQALWRDRILLSEHSLDLMTVSSFDIHKQWWELGFVCPTKACGPLSTQYGMGVAQFWIDPPNNTIPVWTHAGAETGFSMTWAYDPRQHLVLTGGFNQDAMANEALVFVARLREALEPVVTPYE